MCRFALVMTTVSLAAAASLTEVHAQETPNIKKIMNTLHGRDAVLAAIQKDLKADPLKWDDIQKRSAEYLKMAEDLAKNEQPKGTAESWQKFCNAWVADAKKMDDAAKKKDKDATTKARNTLTTSCNACHKAHK